MDYIRAGLIRGTSLSGLIGERYSAGQGLGASIGGAISDSFKAKAVGIKEYFDPLSWVRAATGKGALGNIATAVAGRALGRSQRDIAYFGGYVRRRSTIPSIPTAEPRTSPVSGMGDGSEMLEKIFYFLKTSSEQRRRMDQLSRSFRQEQSNEDERRHQELVRAIRSFSPISKKRTLGDEEETKGKSFIQSFLDGLLNRIGNLISNVLKGALGYSLMKRAVEGFMGGKKDGKVGGVPDKEVAKTGAIADSKSKRFKELLTKSEVDELEKKGYKFDEKRGVFTKDGKLVKTESVAKELGESGAKKFTEATSAGKKVVGEAVEKSMTKKGILKSALKKIPLAGLAFGAMFGIARAMEGDSKGAVAEVVSGASGAIPVVGTAAGVAVDIALVARDTYKDLYGVFPEDDDPDLREERKQEIIEVIEQKLKSISSTPTETKNLDTRDALSQGIEGTGSITPYTEEGSVTTPTAIPVDTSKAVGGRGMMAGPTAEDMANAPMPTPSVPPIPVSRDVPDLTPMPEMSSLVSPTEPIIQTNTNTNIVGGGEDKILSTTTPKQRDHYLTRFLSNSTAVV